MGFDLVNHSTSKSIEVKSCCTIQNSKCNNKKCGTKYNSLFIDACPTCGSPFSKKVKDSRFGINAKELLSVYNKNLFEGFVFCHISNKDHDKSKKLLTLLIEWFKVDFSDRDIKQIQLNYFRNQVKYGKKTTANLLPNSFDFYKLCPLKISEMTIEINYNNLGINPIVKEKKQNYFPLINEKVLRKDEKKVFRKLKSYNPITKTADSKDFTLNIPYRNKSLGKERGDTRKGMYKQLKKIDSK